MADEEEKSNDVYGVERKEKPLRTMCSPPRVACPLQAESVWCHASTSSSSSRTQKAPASDFASMVTRYGSLGLPAADSCGGALAAWNLCR